MIIGLSGKTGTGKSTIALNIADMITEQGGRAEILPFALVLKRECARRFGFPLGLALSQEGKSEIIFHPELPSGCMTIRRILQWYGTDICRKQDPNHWVKIMSILVDGIKSGTTIIIDDIRFPNEADFVLDRGGFLVRVHPYAGWQPTPEAKHESETIFDDWPYNQLRLWHFEIYPEHGREQLFDCARQIIRALREWQEHR